MRAPCASTGGSRPRHCSTAWPVGCSTMPAPTGPGSGTRSYSVTRWPARASNNAAAVPAVPAPTTPTSIDGCTRGVCSRALVGGVGRLAEFQHEAVGELVLAAPPGQGVPGAGVRRVAQELALLDQHEPGCLELGAHE